MAVQHSTLTGADNHEPKGAESAAAGSVYRSTGAGSGSWKLNFGYGEMDVVANTTASTFTASNTFYKVTGSWSSGLLSGATFATDTLTIVTPGVWEVQAVGAINPGMATNTTANLTIAIQQNATSPTKGITLDMGSTNRHAFFSAQLLTLSANDIVTLQVRNNASTNSATFTDVRFLASLVSAT